MGKQLRIRALALLTAIGTMLASPPRAEARGPGECHICVTSCPGDISAFCQANAPGSCMGTQMCETPQGTDMGCGAWNIRVQCGEDEC
jgi:hypothetical protein